MEILWNQENKMQYCSCFIGKGKFFVKDEEFDVYFFIFDYRVVFFRLFVEIKILGSWNIKCIINSGGIMG